jgi:outer membrane protein TolC
MSRPLCAPTTPPTLTPLTVAVAALLLSSGAADAAPTAGGQTLTLRQSVERAVAGNVDLRREGIVLRTTQAGITTALGNFDFVLSADGTFARKVSPPFGANFNIVAQEGAQFDLSLSRNLETGGQLSLAASGGYTDNVGISSYYSGSLLLNFTQPLLRGFGSEVAEANLRKARITRDQELWNRQAHAANVLRDTIIAYWELAYQSADLDIRRSAVALAEQQLRTTEEQIKVGRMGELQAAAVRRAIADDQADVETSEQKLVGRELDLLRLFGTPVSRGFGPTSLRTADAAMTQPHDVDADAETARALEASPALKTLRQGVALSDVDVAVAASSLRPQLDFQATIGRLGRNQDRTEAFNQLFRVDETVGSAGLVFSLPVQNRAARGTEDAARAAGDSARLTAEDLELSIRDGVSRLASQIRSASKRIDLGAASVKYAQQNLEAEQARFQVGQSTNNDVLMRQQELKQAQINAVRAAVDLLEADVTLGALTGDVLETYGVTLKGL